MKKTLCFLLFFCICFSLYAFDRPIIGSWGLILSGEKQEFIRFGQNEIIVMNTLFRARDFERAEDTIFIPDFEGDSIIIQYHLLSQNKLLFIIWNPDRIEESITLILSRL